MTLTETLAQWSSRAAIRGAALVSEDGLLIHDALTSTVDREAVAALAVTVARHAHQLGDAVQAGPLGSVVIELAGGPVIVTGLDQGHTLVVLAVPDEDLGPLLFDIRRDRPRLGRMV